MQTFAIDIQLNFFVMSSILIKARELQKIFSKLSDRFSANSLIDKASKRV